MRDLKAFCISLLKDWGRWGEKERGSTGYPSVCCPNHWKAGEPTSSEAQQGKIQVHLLDWLCY